MNGGENSLAAARCLADAVLAVREDILGMNRKEFCERTAFPESTMAAIEQARRARYRASTLFALDRAMRDAGFEAWPGAAAIMSGRAGSSAARIVTDEPDDIARLRFELFDLVGQLEPPDLTFITAVGRWVQSLRDATGRRTE